MFTRLLINGSIKVAPRGVSIALALPALVRVLSNCGSPGQIIKERAAFLAIQSFSVMHALASTVDLKDRILLFLF